ncbi:hypothetical protein Fmac_016939 [Flemingia macrophylla]|uniref:DUF3730 domain-containing protein n=1 Tax=Flemingia macrophylla TaxID=520843 RepID=A0ABD1MIT5_9FABA
MNLISGISSLSTSQVLGLLASVPIGGTLLLLAGLSLIASLIGLAIAVPLFVLFSPVLVPTAITIGLAVTIVLAAGICGLTGIVTFSWVVNYLLRITQETKSLSEKAKQHVADTARYVGQKTKEVGQDIELRERHMIVNGVNGVLGFRLLIGCLKYLPHQSSEVNVIVRSSIGYVVSNEFFILDYRKFIFIVEHMVEAYIMVLKSLAGKKLHAGDHEPICELIRRLLSVQKDLGLPWLLGLSLTIVSLFTIIVQSEFEHEQISILKLLLLTLKWKYDNDAAISGTKFSSFEETLFLLPVVSLMSSPSKYVKGLATDLLFLLEKLLVKMFVAPKDKPIVEGGVHCFSTPGIIDGESSSRTSLLRFALMGLNQSEMMLDTPISWVSHLRAFCSSIVDQRKSSLPLSHFQEVFLNEMPLLLSAVLNVLLIHPSMGAAAVDSLYGSQAGSCFAANNYLKILEMLPSLASHSAMIPLVVQTILPMLNKDAKVDDFGILLPKRFTDFTSERDICISMAASIRDVCRKSPDRGVDLILSVSSCIESHDPVIKALGFHSLACLCESDAIDFYTAWDVIAKHVQGYQDDPLLAHR